MDKTTNQTRGEGYIPLPPSLVETSHHLRLGSKNRLAVIEGVGDILEDTVAMAQTSEGYFRSF